MVFEVYSSSVGTYMRFLRCMLGCMGRQIDDAMGTSDGSGDLGMFIWGPFAPESVCAYLRYISMEGSTYLGNLLKSRMRQVHDRNSSPCPLSFEPAAAIREQCVVCTSAGARARVRIGGMINPFQIRGRPIMQRHGTFNTPGGNRSRTWLFQRERQFPKPGAQPKVAYLAALYTCPHP